MSGKVRFQDQLFQVQILQFPHLPVPLKTSGSSVRAVYASLPCGPASPPPRRQDPFAVDASPAHAHRTTCGHSPNTCHWPVLQACHPTRMQLSYCLFTELGKLLNSLVRFCVHVSLLLSDIAPLKLGLKYICFIQNSF